MFGKTALAGALAILDDAIEGDHLGKACSYEDVAFEEEFGHV